MGFGRAGVPCAAEATIITTRATKSNGARTQTRAMAEMAAMAAIVAMAGATTATSVEWKSHKITRALCAGSSASVDCESSGYASRSRSPEVKEAAEKAALNSCTDGAAKNGSDSEGESTLTPAPEQNLDHMTSSAMRIRRCSLPFARASAPVISFHFLAAALACKALRQQPLMRQSAQKCILEGGVSFRHA